MSSWRPKIALKWYLENWRLFAKKLLSKHFFCWLQTERQYDTCRVPWDRIKYTLAFGKFCLQNGLFCLPAMLVKITWILLEILLEFCLVHEKWNCFYIYNTTLTDFCWGRALNINSDFAELFKFFWHVMPRKALLKTGNCYYIIRVGTAEIIVH